MTLTHRLFAQSIRDMRSMPAADVEAAALSLLERLLLHAARHVPFYRSLADRLVRAAGDPDAWAALPVIAAGAIPDLFLAAALPSEDVALDGASWTTVSTPVEGATSLLADVSDKGQWEYLLRCRGTDTSGRLAAILPPASLRPGDVAEPVEPWSIDAHRGRAHRWSEAFAPDATLAWLAHIRPACLFLRPATLGRLLEVARPGRLDVSDILLSGPATHPNARQSCEAAFGARLIEVVTSTGGFIARAEPDGLFVPAIETSVVEILDGDGRPSRPGEPGRLVATALYGYRRTVLRQETGLRAVWSDRRSECGRRCFRVLTDE